MIHFETVRGTGEFTEKETVAQDLGGDELK
jgi:hypothetical protein